ncbi:MAG: FAD-dependent oxidoreductase, partial [Nitrospira sp.]|nr:FAD-dependent oxidoreductase [Nitrospira sp.]
QLSLSLLYWLQTEAPRPDGGQGWPGLRLRPDVLGTEDGLAKYPYIRESRRIRARYTIVESDCGLLARAEKLGRPPAEITSEAYPDSVGIGHYAIDLHPSTGGDNYIDFDALPFQIPLGSLLPVRVENVLPACKNIGTTHVTNGAYRLHPVEWNIGESVGALIAFAQKKKQPAMAIREKAELLREFQGWLRDQGVETHWPGPIR